MAVILGIGVRWVTDRICHPTDHTPERIYREINCVDGLIVACASWPGQTGIMGRAVSGLAGPPEAGLINRFRQTGGQARALLG
jgi:hypothetical protein